MVFLRRAFSALVFLLIFVGVLAMDIHLPSQNVPWRPVDLRAPVGPFTGHKLAKLRADPPACHAALTLAGIEYRALADVTGGACPRENLAALRKGKYPYSASVAGNCALLAALAVWEREVVAPAAALHFHAKLRRIDHVGIFACRNVRGSAARQSQHATARAIDITGFLFNDGTRVSVRRDWGDDTAAGRFLKDVHGGACPIFRAVLGPHYNRLHEDHFHFDLGPYNICR